MAPRSKRQRTGNASASKSTISDEKKVDDKTTVLHEATNGAEPASLVTGQSDISGDIESYPDYVKRKKVLLATKEKRIAEADRNRRLQIKNITELFEFEVENLEAKFATELASLKETMSSQMQEETEAAAIRTAADDAEATASSSSVRMATRTVTSSLPTDESVEGQTETVGKAATNGRRRGGALNQKVYSQHLHKILSEENVREDFVDIVRDLEDRAVSYTKQHRGDTLLEVETDGGGSLCIRSKLRRAASFDQSNGSGSGGDDGEEVFRTGCMVRVHSTNSDDDLTGAVVVVGDDDVIVKLHSGPRVRIPYSQLRDRRVTLSRDVDTYRDIALMVAARQVGDDDGTVDDNERAVEK